MDLQKLQKERKHIETITEKDEGKKVTIAGWLYDSRDLGKVRFVIMRDITERKAGEFKIKEQLLELQRWHEATLGRENRIMELKKEVNTLLGENGRPARYSSVEGEGDIHD